MMANSNELSTTQNYLFKRLEYWLSQQVKFNVTKDEDNYFHFNNGKRFYLLHFFKGVTFFGIREDGDTRFVFNGRIETFDDFKHIDNLTTN